MRAKLAKIFSVLLIFVISLNLLGCSIFDRAGDEVADDILADATSISVTSSYNPNGISLTEATRLENSIEEKTFIEFQLEQKLLSELMIEPVLLQESVKLESIRVEVIDSAEFEYDDLGCDSYYTSQLDYSLIHDRLSDGLSLIIAEVVIDTGSLVINVVCANWRSAIVDAAQIAITVGSTSLAGFVAYHVTKAQSLAAGNSYEVAIYDAWDMASTAFFYASVIVDVANTVVSLAQVAKSIADLSKKVPLLVARMKGVVVDATKTISVTEGVNGTFEVIQNGKKIAGKVAFDSKDIYDIKTGKYICSLVESATGDFDGIKINEVPLKITNKAGDLLYRIDENTHEIYKVTKNLDGAVHEISKGIVDEGGFVYSSGKIVSRIDFTTGKTFDSGFTYLKKLDLYTNVFGEITDSTGQVLSFKKIGDSTCLMGSDNKVIAQIYKGEDGIKWLQRADNGRTIGRIAESGSFDFLWKTDLDAARRAATKTARDELVKLVKSGKHSDSKIRRLFPDLTLEQIEYIRTYGKVPQDIQVHHCYNVANYPDKAGDIRNLEFLSIENHKAAHGGDFRRPSSSRSNHYVDLAEVFGIAA